MHTVSVVALLLCMVAYAYSMRPVFELSMDAPDTVNVASELTMTMEDYTPVYNDTLFFSAPGNATSIRFTDKDLQCKEVGMGRLTLDSDGFSMTLYVGDENGGTPEKLICTFDIQTPLQPVIDSTILWNDNEGEPETATLPSFYSRFTSSVSVDDKTPGAHTQYMIRVPSSVPIAVGKDDSVHFEVLNSDYPFDASAVEACTDAEGNEHNFIPAPEEQYFDIQIGAKLQAPVHDTYTFYCFFTNPALPAVDMRPFLVASFNDIYRSYPFSLPTLAVPALSAVTMEYSSNVAGEQIDITLTVAATNVVTAKGEKLTLVTEPAFTFTDSSVCFYTDAKIGRAHV